MSNQAAAKREKKVHGTSGRKESHVFTYIILVIFTLIYLVPIVWMTLSSFKPDSELFTYPPTLFPRSFLWKTILTPGVAATSACTSKTPSSWR